MKLQPAMRINMTKIIREEVLLLAWYCFRYDGCNEDLDNHIMERN